MSGMDAIAGTRLGADWSYLTWAVVAASFALLSHVGYFVVAYVVSYREAASKRSNLPCAPTRFPFGCVSVFQAADKQDMFGDIADKYGEDGVVFLQLSTTPFAMAMRHDHIKTIFSKFAFHNMKSPDAGDDPLMSWLGNESMLFKDADVPHEWKTLRRLAAPSFTRTNVMKLCAPMNKVIARGANFLTDLLRTNGADKALEIEPFIYAMTFDVLGESAFSQDFGGFRALADGKQHKIVKAFSHLCLASTERGFDKIALRPWLKPRYLWIPTKANKEWLHHREVIRTAVEELIEARESVNRANSGEKTFSDFMQTMIDASDDTGTRFTRDQLRDNLITAMFAGHDTSAITLSYLLYRVAKHPEVQQKLFEEAERVLPNGTSPTSETYTKLEYTQLTIKETLRLHAPAHSSIRACEEDIQVGKFLFKKGTGILLPLYSAMRSEMNYTDALAFRPERHLEEEAQSRLHAFIPFSRGVRTCIGQRFAEMSAAMMLAALVQRFEFRLPDDYVMQMKYTAPTQRPKDPLRLYISERKR